MTPLLFVQLTSNILLVFTLYFIFGLLEQLYPAQKKQTIRGKLRNLVFTSFFITAGLITVVLIPPPSEVQPFSIFSGINKMWFIFTYFFFFDVIYYWYHRVQHSSSFLWLIHKLHHSDTELNATTSMRTHWLEPLFQILIISIPARYIIGWDVSIAHIVPIVFTAWLLFTHANIKISSFIFKTALTGPQIHRTHHSNLPQHQDKNFAQFFPVIDMIFGTYYEPKKDEFTTTGTDDMPTNVSFERAWLTPWK